MDSCLLADEVLLCERATTFTELSNVALAVLRRMPADIGQVCGPISTGGKGSIPANREVFFQAIAWLLARGHRIFDQMPFEDHIFRIIAGGYNTRFNNQLLREFYGPIFWSGLVQTFFFIPGWESSEGARWEHSMALQYDYRVVYMKDIGFPA